jgi:hypothetical protein
MKSRNIVKQNKKENIIQKQDLKNLDDFIQKCLDNFKFVEPKKELYEATGLDKDIIISHKSTIPDLVIWNKTFNKNNCFIGANTSIQNEFPRFLFYIKIKKNKKTKNNNKKDNNNFNIEFFENNNINKNNNINSERKDKKNYINELNKNIENQDNKKNDILSENNKIKLKINEEKNKFSINQNINVNINNNLNNLNMINLTIYLIQLYMDKNGWIILTKDEHFSGPGTSMDLFQFLQEKIKENINLNELIIIDINKQVKYYGNYFYILLSNILPSIIQKKQLELLKFESIMNKQHQNLKTSIDNIHYNNNYNINNNINFSKNNNYNILNYNSINNNIYNNNLFSGINYNSNNNLSNVSNLSNGINQINNYTINNINNINNINQYLLMNNNIAYNVLNNKDNINENNTKKIENNNNNLENKNK